jgi:hypothetical protein
MPYTFINLSYADFEDLARDLIGAELRIRFEAFAPGPDGGMDGRHAVGKKTTVLQAKQYAGSTFATLNAEMKRARQQIDALKSNRYILATSRQLTPANKAALATTIGPALKAESDIFGARELNGLLQKHPEVEKASIKLWLSSAAVLDRVLHAASHTFTTITREEIKAKLDVYAPNPSFNEARNKLEKEHVIIIAGPPGVGKTTLAQMLSYAYLAEEWDYIAIRSLDDGFARLNDTRKQIFFFDDFLGTAALDTRALQSKDADLTRFLKRVRSSANARFVLTTRAPIFEEARRVSEHLADKRLDIAKYVLDVGMYTRRIRARILYNHLAVSGVSAAHIAALWNAGAIPNIVDHANYNPRIIEAMTDGILLKDVAAEDYPALFIRALDFPHQIWDTAFRKHIPEMCRHLLIALYFSSDYGVSIDELRYVFDGLHAFLSQKYGYPFDAKDFEEALRILESGFIEISGRDVSFINPSLRDYLASYITDVEQVVDYSHSARKADWAERVWKHVRERLWSPAKQQRIAKTFIAVAERFPQMAIDATNTEESRTFRDLDASERLDLLLSWAVCGDEQKFEEIAMQVITQLRFSPWRDGVALVRMLSVLGDETGDYGDLHTREALHEAVKEKLFSVLESWVPIDDLENIFSEIEGLERYLPNEVVEAVEKTMLSQFENMDSLAEETSDSTLNDHATALKRFAPRLGVSHETLDRALKIIADRKESLAEETPDTPAPTLSSRSGVERDTFDDNDLNNLFSPLLHGHA